MRTTNPALSPEAFSTPGTAALTGAQRMTVAGAINRTGFLLVLVVGAAAWPWHLYSSSVRTLGDGSAMADPSVVFPYLIGGLVGGLVLALVTIFKKSIAHLTAPAYAVFEGLFLGSMSAVFEGRYPGIVVPAVGLTFGTLLAMLAVYRAGIVRPTARFQTGLLAATGGIALLYLATMTLGFFGVRVPYIHDAGPIGIAFSLFVVGIAALNLVLDFAFIEQGAARGAAKRMEWYGAFGLLVTLVWLYLEILRLLAKMRRR